MVRNWSRKRKVAKSEDFYGKRRMDILPCLQSKIKEIKDMDGNRNQIRIYLIFVLGICWALGIAAFCLQGNSQNTIYQILQKGFTAFPVIAALLQDA